MFSFSSSRRLVLPAVSLMFLVLIYKLLTTSAPSASRTLIARKVLSQLPHGTLIQDDDITKYMIPTRLVSQAHLSPPPHFYYGQNFSAQAPPDITHLETLLACTAKPNRHTKHIRLPNLVFNVSSTSPDAESDDVKKFNPTIIALPYWSANHYLLVSRVVTEGLHQESLLCEANICHRPNSTSSHSSACTPSDLSILGASGGLRCATAPVIINIPPTPAERCSGVWSSFPDIPGFHDPRVLWTGTGAPLIMVNSASRYGCVGLWVVDLRTVYEPLHHLLLQVQVDHDGRRRDHGPLMSYPQLTELTRNPRRDRAAVEKNWLLFFPRVADEAWLHYDMVAPSHLNLQSARDASTSPAAPPSDSSSSGSGSGRAFARLLGNGYTTPNLADPAEASCFSDTRDARGRPGHWHQGSNALSLVLRTRAEARLSSSSAESVAGRNVHFAVMHRKFSNAWELPLRYERWFVLWEGEAPFRLLARSRWPVLLANETAGGWTAGENWVDDEEEAEEEKEEERGKMRGLRHWGNATWLNGSAGDYVNSTGEAEQLGDHRRGRSQRADWAAFTYTPSIAWAWRPKSAEVRRDDRDGAADGGSYLRSLNVGYLDDEVIVSIGLEDKAQAFAKVEARSLLQCLEVCPGARRIGKEDMENS